MATFRPSEPLDPVKINQWRGVNESVGLTNLQLGEMLRQVNYRITNDYKLEKREGHKFLFKFGIDDTIQGMWEGHLNNKHVLVYCVNGNVYVYEIKTGYNTQIGSITDARTSMIYFQGKLLFFNGTDFKEYDGTTFKDVEPYVPTIFIASPPEGGGIPFEPVNLLTGYKKQQFQGDGTAKVFVIAEKPIESSGSSVKVNGFYVDYIKDQVTGEFTLTDAPEKGDLVEVEWLRVNYDNEDLVRKNRFCKTFGPGNDTAIFLWGNPDQKNRRTWCASLNYSYWPVDNFTYVGTDEYAITDIVAQNANYQMIFKEDRTYFSLAEQITLSDGTVKYDYPVYDLNERVGNICFNGVQLVGDNAISIDQNSWWQWSTAAVESQRNANVISHRLQQSLSGLDLSKAVTFNYVSRKEYWCNVGNIVYVWNYGNNTMYTFDNISATQFLEIDGIAYYASTHGTIERMNDINDNGVAVVAQADTGFYPFSGINLIKSSDIVFIGLLPDTKTSLTIYFKTNKITEWKKIRKTAFYSLIDLDNIDFDNFTFLTNSNPQTFALEFSSNDYVYIQFRLENAEKDEPCTVLDFLVQAEVQGEV